MSILISVLVILLTATVLLVIRFRWPDFRYPWIIAAAGSLIALISVFLWRVHFPQIFSPMAWGPQAIFSYPLTWMADDISWPYALALAALAAAVIWTSVVRAENDPVTWAGTLILAILGLLAVTAANSLTLVLMWTALDFTEFISMLPSIQEAKRSEGLAAALAVRVSGTGLILWAATVSSSIGASLDFRSIPSQITIYILLAVGLRLGVLPFHIPYRQENILQRGFGTALRLVSCASNLALLARLPTNAGNSALYSFLLVLLALVTLYSGWMWLRASDEILGRPFWVLGMACMSFAAILRGNPTGSIAWGVALILGGSFLFLYSARQKNLIWFPATACLGLTALPYSLSATGWQASIQLPQLILIPMLPGQALLMAGFIRHAIHPGETSFESQVRWAKVIYPFGLMLLILVEILLGIWGWSGARTVGLWWASLTALILAAGFTISARTILSRFNPGSGAGLWTKRFQLNWLYQVFKDGYRFLRRVANQITATLEGEGGVLWSIVLLVLILSILSTRGR